MGSALLSESWNFSYSQDAPNFAGENRIVTKTVGQNLLSDYSYADDNNQINAPHEYVRRWNVPKSYKTLLSPADLEWCGLAVYDDTEAQSWLVRTDADRLAEEPASTVWLERLIERVRELKELSADEDLAFSQSSADEAIGFAKGIRAYRLPSAFLLGNGNVRLLWTSGKAQIGLQFLGGGTIQYVMFADRLAGTATHMGTDDGDTILRQISVLGLRHLLSA